VRFVVPRERLEVVAKAYVSAQPALDRTPKTDTAVATASTIRLLQLIVFAPYSGREARLLRGDYESS